MHYRRRVKEFEYFFSLWFRVNCVVRPQRIMCKILYGCCTLMSRQCLFSFPPKTGYFGVIHSFYIANQKTKPRSEAAREYEAKPEKNSTRRTHRSALVLSGNAGNTRAMC